MASRSSKLPDLPAGKFDGVDTVDMFELIELPPQRSLPSGEQGKKQRTAGSGECPSCHAKTGVLVKGEHLVWRQHWRPLGAGTDRIVCATSSRPIHEARPVQVEYTDVPECTCEVKR